jgi:hypothetical protein
MHALTVQHAGQRITFNRGAWFLADLGFRRNGDKRRKNEPVKSIKIQDAHVVCLKIIK